MRKSNVAFAEFSQNGHLPPGRPFTEVDLQPPFGLPIVDLIELYAGIEFALPRDDGAIIQFIGATPGFGSGQIVLDMAWAAISSLGKRVLILNCAKVASYGSFATGPQSLDHETILEMATAERKGMAKVAGRELYFADLRSILDDAENPAVLDQIDDNLDRLRSYFDMIVLVPPPTEADPIGIMLARHVDGSVVVVEAEETRRASAVRLREILTRSGRPVIGAVLNNRKSYIPGWLARFL